MRRTWGSLRHEGLTFEHVDEGRLMCAGVEETMYSKRRSEA